MMMKPLTAALTVFTYASGAQAGTYSVPEGCSGFLTVQSRMCEVDHYWRCEADPEGVFWRLTIQSDGPSLLSKLDSEYRWLEMFRLKTARREQMSQEVDPQSMSELLETGSDSWTFDQDWFERGEFLTTERYSGYDRLTGDTVEIDGVTLRQTEYHMRSEFSATGETFVATGNEYVYERFNIFLGGIGVIESRQGREEYDNTPVEFSEPGEQGFLATSPLFDCGDILSGLDVPLSQHEGTRRL
ncbi:hypothetical protein [Cochlodiniinecator piscidefendens]|uniref:hypothetical protein n=1 Tax=Cochlodiniinecator piscidefendens TaxID=2715756 RepID=UPI00140C9E3E|nr:hypothetical protein [Cochlodiniinecator piscidefendens]